MVSKITKTIILLLLSMVMFDSYAISFESIKNNKDYDIYYIDLNHDGINDAIANNNSENAAQIFIKKNNQSLTKKDIDVLPYRPDN